MHLVEPLLFYSLSLCLCLLLVRQFSLIENEIRKIINVCDEAGQFVAADSSPADSSPKVGQFVAEEKLKIFEMLLPNRIRYIFYDHIITSPLFCFKKLGYYFTPPTQKSKGWEKEYDKKFVYGVFGVAEHEYDIRLVARGTFQALYKESVNITKMLATSLKSVKN